MRATVRARIGAATIPIRRRPRVHQTIPLATFARVANGVTRFEAWRGSEQLREAERAMAYLVGETHRAAEVPELARRHLFLQRMRVELEARPQVTANQPVENAEVFKRLQAAGRGVLLNYMHHGFYAGVGPSFGARGLKVHLAAAPQYFTGQFSGYWGMRNRWHTVTVLTNGTVVFPAAGQFNYMADLLRSGEIVALSHDFPGKTWGTFLGRRVGSTAGAAMLAMKTGAPIVVVSAHPRGLVAELRVQEPIEPHRFDSVAALQQEILRRHEPAVLAWPEALVTPLTRWRADPDSVARFGAQPR